MATRLYHVVYEEEVGYSLITSYHRLQQLIVTMPDEQGARVLGREVVVMTVTVVIVMVMIVGVRVRKSMTRRMKNSTGCW